MEPTPEERQRIYEEEKARLEAQGRIKSKERQRTASRIGIGLVVMLGLLVLLWVLGSLSDASRMASSSGGPRGPSPISYRVDSYPGEADVSFTIETGGINHLRLNQQHWEETLRLPSGTMAYIAAQNTFDYGHVTVTIACNGQEVKRSESNGAYVIATVSAVCD